MRTQIATGPVPIAREKTSSHSRAYLNMPETVHSLHFQQVRGVSRCRKYADMPRTGLKPSLSRCIERTRIANPVVLGKGC